ncbi:MAG: tetratricopeptide repeat protein [bacterium]|nr:tetratricopeptide repeat protein [bacterium]
MKKVSLITLVLLFILGGQMVAQMKSLGEDPSMTMNFDVVSLKGKILDESMKPAANVLLEICVSPDVDREIVVAGAKLNGALIALSRMYGDGNMSMRTADQSGKRKFSRVFFAKHTSNEKGEFCFTGVMKPGVYEIVVRNNDAFLSTRLKVNVTPGAGSERQVQDLILKTRKGAVLSKKAQKILEKARKANKAEAVGLFKKVLEIHPKYAEGHFNIGILLRADGKLDKAAASLQKAVDIRKDYTLAYKELAETLLVLKKYAPARKCFLRCIGEGEEVSSLGKDNIIILKKIALCSVKLKDIETANRFLSNYIEQKKRHKLLTKEDARTCKNLGDYYYGKKLVANAVFCYKEALTLNPDLDESVYIYLGNSYFFSKDLDSATKVFKLYLKRNPKAKDAEKIKNFVENIVKMKV